MIEAARTVLHDRAPDPGVEGMIAALDQLELARLDDRSRSHFSGLWWSSEAPQPQGRWWRWLARRAAEPEPGPGPPRALHLLLLLMADDGHERERAVREVPLGRAAAALIAIRCADWVPQVRQAALERVETTFGRRLLAELLPLVERVTVEWSRGDELDRLVERMLDDETLAGALDSADPRTRREAWRRLLARGPVAADRLARGLADPDARVRMVVAGVLPGLAPDERRALATTLLSDPVGKLAARGLDALVELDGPAVLPEALVAGTATLRRRAREWAALHGVEVRPPYLARLERDPADAIALMALAETADRRDLDTIRRALEDPRARVRAVALRALATLDQDAGRTAAVGALLRDPAGRVTRAAAQVLRLTRPFDDDAERIADLALDGARSPRLRLRAISVLRRFRWRHLAVVLAARATADGELRDGLEQELTVWLRRSPTIGIGPDPATRSAIEAALPSVDATRRRQIEFVLRTTSR